MEIGLFYGSTTCYTEMAAEKIQNQLNDLFDEPVVQLHNIKDVSIDQAQQFDLLIFGISTWDFGELQEDWESQWQDVAKLDLSGKTLALFGMGDQQGYADWFVDAMGMLHDVCVERGAQPIGYWPNSEDYEFAKSKALTEDGRFFVGLALDDESQYELTDARIEQWCTALLAELA